MTRRFKFCCMVTGRLFLSLSFAGAATQGEPAPTFTLTNGHHQQRTLASYKGKICLINFWASWCGPCAVELPQLNRLATDYKGKPFRVIAVNVDPDSASARKLLTHLGLTDPPLDLLWDPQSKAVSAYNIESMPSSFIVDEHGLVRFVHAGFHRHDPAAWRNEIDSLLQKTAIR